MCASRRLRQVLTVREILSGESEGGEVLADLSTSGQWVCKSLAGKVGTEV